MSEPEEEVHSPAEPSSEESADATPGGRVRLNSMVPSDIPHIYPYSSRGNPCVKCAVCKKNIDIKGKERQYVVRCSECKEATPIKMPPGDKKYVRCVCNCLITCRAEAMRIICPREECHRILDIGHPAVESRTPGREEGNVQVTCFYCKQNFIFNTSQNKLARCPHCKKTSAVGRRYKLRSATAYLVVAVIAAVIGAICIFFTWQLAKTQIGYYILYVCLFFSAILLFLRSVYYFLMPVSLIFGPY